MRNFALCVGAFAVLVAQSLAAQAPEPKHPEVGQHLPSIILAGLQTYRDKGPYEAIKTWLKGSPLEGSRDATRQANTLRSLEDNYGTYRMFEVVGRRSLSERTRVFYLELDFDRGPLFAKFVSYRSQDGWILTGLNFSTRSEEIYPVEPSILSTDNSTDKDD